MLLTAPAASIVQLDGPTKAGISGCTEALDIPRMVGRSSTTTTCGNISPLQEPCRSPPRLRFRRGQAATQLVKHWRSPTRRLEQQSITSLRGPRLDRKSVV